METRDDALIDVLYNVKNIAIFQEDIYIGSGEQLIVWDKYGKFKRVLSKKGNDPQSYFHFRQFHDMAQWRSIDRFSSLGNRNLFKFTPIHSTNGALHENIGLIEAITPIER
ncbi:MAG: 6-bladed beta-propeller [Parabacteroides distasonis]